MTQLTVPSSIDFAFRGKWTGEYDPQTKKKVIERSRENFSAQIQLLTVDGVKSILNGDDPKQIDAIVLAINDVILTQARKQVNDDESIKGTGDFDHSKLTWEAISQLEADERSASSASAPNKEQLEAFYQDFIKIMPAAAGMSSEAAVNAGKEIRGKFRVTRLRPDLLTKLMHRLNTWAEASDQVKDDGPLAPVYEYLIGKAESLIKAVDEADNF